MKRFCTLLLALCVCVVPSLLPAQTWVNGQPATLVIGQNSFTGNAPNFMGNITQGLSWPDGVVVGNGKLFVSDRANHRVLRYSLPLTGNYPIPEIVFGQTTFTGNMPNSGGTTNNAGFNTPIGLAYNAGMDELWVADFGNNRVLRFAGAAATGINGIPANLVIGQIDFMTATAGLAANTLNGPHNVALDIPNSKVYVSDLNNNRVLRYDATALLMANTSAECVFGQIDAMSGGAGLGTNQFNAPSSIVVGGAGSLYVSDVANHRVLRFDNAHLDMTNLAVADGVLGQPNFTSSASGLSANQFNSPAGLSLSATNDLYVCDENNRRILRFANANTVMTGMPNANLVLGQQNFVVNNAGVQRTICTDPRYVFFDGTNNRLYVTEGAAVNRVLVFDANLPTLNNASPLLDANSGTPTQVIAPMFSQVMNLPTTTNFRAFGSMTGLKGGAYLGGMSPSFTPTAPYQRGERVEYTITTGATIGDGVSTNPGNKPFLNGLRPFAPATPFVGSFRVASGPVIPAGSVNFVLSTYANVGGAVASIMPADFDGDGYADFAAFVPSLNRIAVRRNLNWGNFAKNIAPEFLDISVAGMSDTKLADINNDGKIDWVYTDATSISYSLNNSTPGMFVVGGGTTTAVGGAPLKLETGDFNGDGNIDAVVVTATQLRVFRNTGTGFVLHSTTNFQVGETPTAIAKGDFNRDGSFDIVIGFSGSNNIRTYRNDGGGVMVETLINLAVPAPPTQIVTGDIDGVNGSDFVAVMPNAVPSEVRRFLNNGAAGFMAIASTNIPNFAATTGGVDLGNINGDAVAGNLDIVAVNPQAAGTPSSLTWFTNDGAGAFNGGATFSGSTGLVDNIAQAVALADVDADGDLDALVGYGTGAAFPYVAVLRNEQQTYPTTFVPAINAQNVQRTVMPVPPPISQSFLTNIPAPTLTNMTSGTAMLVDFLTGGSGPMRIYGNMTGGRSRVGGGGTWGGSGTNTATFAPTNLIGPSSANRFHPGELVSVSIPAFQTNAVKNLRFVPMTSGTATNLGGHVRQFRTNVTGGPGAFVEVQRINSATHPPFAGISPSMIRLADMDNDGRMDIICREGGGGGNRIVIFRQTSIIPLTYTVYAVVTVPGITNGRFCLGDFNNDGLVDIVASGDGVGDIYFLRNDGAGAFMVQTPPAGSINPGGMPAAADVNGDGHLDIVRSNYNFGANSSFTVWYGNGSATPLSQAPTNFFTQNNAQPHSVEVGDLNNDGDLDVVMARLNGASRIEIGTNNGVGTFVQTQLGAVTGAGAEIVLGDFNGDNLLDIASSSFDANGTVQIFLNSTMTPGTFSAGQTFLSSPIGHSNRSMRVADVNGDGFLDLVCGSNGNSTINVFRGTGAGTFNTIPFTIGGGSSTVYLDVADIDGDGDIDIVAPDNVDNSIRIILNAKPPRILSMDPYPQDNESSIIYRRDVQPRRNTHTQAFGTFPLRVRFDQPVTSATASFPNVLPPMGNRGAIRIHGSMTGHRSTPAAVGTWNYIAGTNTAEYIAPGTNPFRAGETVMVTVTNAQSNPPLGAAVFSTSPTVYSFTVAPSGGTGRFVDSRRYPSTQALPGLTPLSTIVGQYDNNPGVDIAVANFGGAANRLTIIRNDGLGLFPPATNFVDVSVGTDPRSMVNGDFDNDGDVDIIVVCGTSNDIWFVRNNNNGTYTPFQRITGLSNSVRITTADFNGDGAMDIAIAQNNPIDRVKVYINTGNANFLLAQNFVLSNAYSIEAADMDADGDMDLVIGQDIGGSVFIAENSGFGTFTLLPAIATGFGAIYNLQSANLNADIFPDIVVSSFSGTCSLATIMSTGSLMYSPTSLLGFGATPFFVIPHLCDIDGNGNIDIVGVAIGNSNPFGANIYVWRNGGAGVFGSPDNSSQLVGSSIALGGQFASGDFDGDGDIDLVIPKYSDNQVAILYNHQPELKVFSTSPPANANAVMQPVTITTTFNQNVTTGTAQFPNNAPAQGPLRIYGGMTGGRSRITGGGTWAVPPMPPTPFNNPSFLPNNIPIIGQTFFPGEKVEFIASTNARIQGPPGVANTVPMTTGTVRQFWTRAGVGPATFFQHHQSPIATPNPSSIVVTADLNNDGRVDFITSEDNTTLRVYTGNGNGTFTVGAAVTTPATAVGDRRIALADMDNDGDIDIIHTNALGAAEIRMFPNNGTATFLAPVITATSLGSVRGIAVGDVSGDGYLDIGVSYNASTQVGVFFNRGDGTLNAEQNYTQPGGGGREETSFADMDNDGDLDWVITNGPANSVSIRLNNGAGNFAVEAIGSPYATTIMNPTNIQLADITGDGRIDAVVGGPNADVNIFVNTASPTIFPAAATLTIPTTSNRPLLADFNGDTRQDITVLQRTPGNFVVGLGNNTGTFPTLSLPNQVGTANLNQAIADVDNDGDLDILIAADNTVQVWMNATQPRFVCTAGCGPVTYTANISPQRNTQSALAASLMTWQFTEPMTTATASFPLTMPPPAGGAIHVFGNMRASRSPNNAAGANWTYTGGAVTTATLAPAQAFLPGEQIIVSVTNAQSPSGIAVRPYVYSFRARAGVGPGQFYPRAGLPIQAAMGAGPRAMAFGDMNADGIVDMVVANQFANNVAVRIGDGTGNFPMQTAGSPFATGGNFPLHVVLADMDNNGTLDVVTVNAAGGANGTSIFFNTGGTGVLGVAVNYNVGGNPNGIAVGDVDSDGDLDIVAADAGSALATVRFNNGTGTLTAAAPTYGIGTGQAFVRLADVDNDADLDIIATNGGGAANVTVRLNDGLGNFTGIAPGSPYAATGAVSVDIGDIDNDGDNDMLLTLGTGDVVLRTNNGVASGDFSTVSATFTVGIGVQQAVFGDVNGDGNLDIITSIGPVGNAGTLSVKLGNGAGVFTDAANVPFGLQTDARGIALADVDGDGDLDVGIAYQGTENSMGIMLNATQPRLVCASMSDCGLPAYTRAISPQRNINTAPNQPPMTWQFTEQITTNTYTAIGGTQGPARIFGMMSAGQRNIGAGGTWAYAMMTTTATFNPTRRFLMGEEVMVTITSAQSPARVNMRPFVYSYRTRAGAGPSIFGNETSSPYSTGTTPRDVATGDIDGDGDADILVATGTGVERRLNDGTASFNMGTLSIATISNPTGIALGDADNDGDLDIAVCNSAGQFSLLINDGTGAFATKAGFPLTFTGDHRDIQWGDLDGDGDLDVAVANFGNPQIVLGINNNSPANLPSGFTFSTAVSSGGAPTSLRISDVDNDGDMDIVAANASGAMSGLSVMLNSGTGTFAAPVVIGVGAAIPSGITTGDVNGDGWVDVVMTTAMGDNALVYRNSATGDGSFTLNGSYPVATDPRDVLLGDTDGDGDLDMIVVNKGANTATLRRNSGSGDFNLLASGSPYGLGMQPQGAAFADLDGDGDLDFVSANTMAGTFSVLLNQGNAGLGFSLTEVGQTDTFNAGIRTITSRAPTPFTVGSFLGRTNLSITTATLQYSIQAAAGGTAQFTMQGSTQGTINMATSVSTIATFVWRNAPVGGGTTTAVITVAPTFAGFLNATQITVTVVADPAYPLVLAYSYNSSTGTQGVNAGAFNQGQLLISNGRPFNLAFGAWNGWTELAATTASLRLRAFNTLGAEGTFTLNSTLTTPNILTNSATGIFSNLTIRWLNPPEAAVSTQVTVRLETVGAPMLASTSVTLTMTKISPEPQITSFSPTTGATGTIITVRGLTFSNVAAAAIAGVPVQSFTINSANQITLVAAAGTSGTITLSNSFGTGESQQIFTFVQYPSMVSVQPSRVCAGQTLTITGTNLEDVQRVFVGSVAAASFRFNAIGQIEAIVPNGAESGIVTVQNRAGTATAATVYVQTPVITGIQPTAIGTGGTLTVVGTNMQAVNAAALGMNGLTIVFQNSTTLTLRAATNAQVTTAPLRLESASGCVVLSTQAIAVAAPPTLTMVSTTMPEVGQTFVITGANFVPGSTVSLGGVTAASVTFVSPTELQVSFGMNALAAASQGAVLQVNTPFGTASLMNSAITLLPQTIIPSGIDFTPESGTRNSTITITGRGFLNVRQVFFGTTPALSFTVETPERIVALVSTGATGTVRVQSTTGTGESMRVFTYVTPQELDSLAALAFFRATNGMNWATNANWQSRSPITTWFGLVISNSGVNAGRITAVNLPSNGLTGSVTNAIIALSQMSVLQTVNLSGNPIGGTLGSVVAGLRSVRTLNMTATQLSGRLPLELGTLDSLEILKLDSNRLDGTIADIFCNVFGRTVRDYSLREMRLSANRLTGDIPPCIVQFTKLQVLRLDDNVFSGRIPEGINRLASLREFVLARNRLTGQLPRSLDSTTFAAFVGKETAQTQALTQLEIFDVSSNQLSGTIPNGIAQSKAMKTLLLNNNAFTGSLPETIPSLSQLETLNAAQNQLSGEIWDNAGSLRSLKTLSLANNRLSGIIPLALTQIAALERLELDNNVLAGEIPTNFNRLANMRILGLSGNQFTAAPALNPLRQTLDSVRLERNRLTFESLESSVQVRNITYSPQDSVGTTERKFFLVGSPITLNFSVGGAFNRYQWFKNGVAATEVQESPMFTIAQNALANNSGAYECRITNSLARNLTLFARTWTVIVDTAAPTTPDALGNQVAAPRLVFPSAAGRNLPYSLPLRWTNAEGASVYEAQVSLLSDFSVLSTNATQPSTTLSVSSLRPGTRYYWRVRGIGAQGQRSVWSSSFFTTGVSDKPMQMTSVDFGKVSLADSADGEALIVNFSNVPQTLQEITLDDPNLSFSVLDSVKQIIIPAEKYISVRVRFAPRSTGVKLASSILRYNETLRPERIDSVQNILQGIGVALKLSNVDFDTVRAGGTTIRSALLINTSPRNVTVGAARAENLSGESVFSVETYLGDKNFTLKPNDTVSIVVRCTPPNIGRKFAGLLVLGENESVTAEIRAVARAYKDGDVVVRFGVRPVKDLVAPGGSVDLQLYIKADTLTKNLTTDLLRAAQPRFQARFRFDPQVLALDKAESRARQQTVNGTTFVTIPVSLWNFDANNRTARELPLLTLKALSVSGSTTSTALQIDQASWEALNTSGGASSSLFVEAPINSTFNSLACVAGGVRLTTTAKANNIAVARPNPVKDVAEILYTVREDAQITLSVMDMAGKQVLLVADGYAEAGEYSLLLNAKTIPSGSYFLVLQTPSGVVKRRIDVVK